MKRYVAIFLSLLGMVGLVTAVFANIERRQGMGIRFNKRDLPKHGVHIITSVDSDFQTRVSDYLKGESVENVSPMSVLVENKGNKTVVAYMLVWQVVKKNGQVVTDRTAYSEPGILTGDPIPTDPAFKHTQAILPNEVKLLPWGSQGMGRLGTLNASSNNQQHQVPSADLSSIRAQLSEQLSEATDVTVSLDGIFFDDGSFVGPNTSSYFERIEALVKAKLNLRSEVAVATEQGRLSEVFEVIEKKSQAPKVILNSDSSPEDYYKHYEKLFAAEISGMHRAYGKERLAQHLVKLHKQPRPQLKKA